MSFKDVLPVIPLVVDAARSPEHRLPIRKQLLHGGEKAKIIAVSRMLGNWLLDPVLGDKIQQSFSFPGTVTKKPLAYGVEAVVYGLEMDEGRFVIKLFNNPECPESQIAKYSRWQEQTANFFGTQLEPTQFMTGQNPFSKKRSIAIGLQKYINGDDLFVAPSMAIPEEVNKFSYNVRAMQEATGLVPDLSGTGNVLVTHTGEIKIIDTGYPMNPFSGDKLIGSRLQMLSENSNVDFS